MYKTSTSNHPVRRVLLALVSVGAAAAVACSGKVSVSPTEPHWPIPTPGLRTLQITGSLAAEQGSCLEATILFDGQELPGARTWCPGRTPCDRLELEASTFSATGVHTVSFQVLQQSGRVVEYMATGAVMVTRANIALPGVALPLGPTRARLQPGEVVTFEFTLSD